MNIGGKLKYNKIVIIGAGAVGSSLAFSLTYNKYVNEVVLIDQNENLAKGVAVDINSCMDNMSSKVIRSGNYEDCIDSVAIVITAGVSRVAGQSRSDLLDTNRAIMSDILDKIAPYYSDAFIVIVSNPVDELTTFAYEYGHFSVEKICGTGCALDTYRLISVLAEKLSVDKSKIKAWCLGGHGDKLQIMWDEIKIEDLSLREFCEKEKIKFDSDFKEIVSENVKNMGMEIIKKTGKSIYGIASVTYNIIDALLKDEYTFMVAGVCFNEAEIAQSAIVQVGKEKILFDKKS